MSAVSGRRAVLRYAEALYESAVKAGDEDRIGDELAQLMDMWVRTPELQGFLAHPLVPTEAKESFLAHALGGELHAYTVNTLRLMTRRGRASLLPQLRGAYLRAGEERGRLLRAVLHSARPVSPQDLETIRSQLRSATGRVVVLDVESAPELLAGAELEVAGRRLDVSLRGRLARLAEELKG